jgi:hypothetical protein
MLQAEISSHDVFWLARHMLASIKEVNIRIRELKGFLSDGCCKEDKKNEILQRIERLIDTKFCIIYSIYDIRKDIIQRLSWDCEDKAREVDRIFDLKTLYEELKDL